MTTDGPDRLTALRTASALVFVEDLSDPVLGVDDERHLLAVLRLSSGARIILSNGRGGAASARLVIDEHSSLSRRRSARLELSCTWQDEPPAQGLCIAFALQKGERADWTVQKLTELGIDTIAPFISARTIVRLAPKERATRGERLRRVAREAASQCRRTILPEVRDPVEFDELLATLPRQSVLAEPGGAPMGQSTTAVVIGPEGGFAPAELDCGLPRVGLGQLVLRAETAAIAAASLLVARRGGYLPGAQHQASD